jgi:glucose/arabinose dehydrogenase
MKQQLGMLSLALVLAACGQDNADQEAQQPLDAPAKATSSVGAVGPSLVSTDEEITLNQQWRTEGLRTPESVLYHQGENGPVLYVSEIQGESTAADGQGGIAKMSPAGKMINRDWVRGLNAPKGMAIHQGTLYVSDLHDVVAIDIASGKVKSRVTVPDSVFLNDIAVDSSGNVFVSDTRTNKVHRIQGNASEVYLENVEGANGLTFVDDTLYVAAADSLWRVDDNKQLTRVAQGFEENADGVEQIAPGEFIVSSWAGLVYHVDDQGELKKLLDTRGKGNTADIGWNPEQEVLYVPTFNTHAVVAYKVEQ